MKNKVNKSSQLKEIKKLKAKVRYYKNLRVATFFFGIIGGLISFVSLLGEEFFIGICLLIVSVSLFAYVLFATIKRPWKMYEKKIHEYENQLNANLSRPVKFSHLIFSGTLAIFASIYILFFIWFCLKVPSGKGPGIIIVPLFIIFILCLAGLIDFFKKLVYSKRNCKV